MAGRGRVSLQQHAHYLPSTRHTPTLYTPAAATPHTHLLHGLGGTGLPPGSSSWTALTVTGGSGITTILSSARSARILLAGGVHSSISMAAGKRRCAATQERRATQHFMARIAAQSAASGSTLMNIVRWRVCAVGGQLPCVSRHGMHLLL